MILTGVDLIAIATAGVTLAAGLVGGYGGYLLEKIRLIDEQTQAGLAHTRDRAYLKMSLVLGIIAAFTIPTFLQFMTLGSSSESLLQAVLNKNVDKWFVYVGLCLLAGFSGQQFVKKLSSELLNDAVKKANIARADAEEALEELEELREDVDAAALTAHSTEIDSELLNVLKAVELHDKRRPNIRDITNATGMSSNSIIPLIKQLEERYMLSGKEVLGESTWRSRSAGRAAMQKSELASESNRGE